MLENVTAEKKQRKHGEFLYWCVINRANETLNQFWERFGNIKETPNVVASLKWKEPYKKLV